MDPRLRVVPDEEWGQRIVADEYAGAMLGAMLLVALLGALIGVVVGLLLGWWLL